MRVVYLACPATMPDSANPRDDAFEHQQMMDVLVPAFQRAGLQLEDRSWDDKSVSWSNFDMAIIGTTWDYQDRLPEFLAALEDMASKTLLANPLPLVRWNVCKTYLRDLQQRGVPIIDTLWFDSLNQDDLSQCFEAFATDMLVIKNQVGAAAEGQIRLQHGDAVDARPYPVMVQPYLDVFAREGEVSFIFIGGQFSHALSKHPAKGDYRVQSLYGGFEAPYMPTMSEIASASAVLDTLSPSPLYARVDMVCPDDQWLVVELELVEPFLYPIQGPGLGDLMASAVRDQLS